ncbi:MAG: Lpg1974 family pore-forming outer membrane protein [Chlamydiales bacterium]|nr:Lpg1974 family pore-forming outer membrane protein [Chlamydiales bacterium]
MLQKIKLFTALTMLSWASACAYSHPPPGGWAVSGDYLYMLPTFDDTYFVIDSPVTSAFPNGTRENNDFRFSTGYRVGGVLGLDVGREFQAYYTNLGVDRSKTITGDFLWATIGQSNLVTVFENYAGAATSNLHLLYQRADGILAQQAFNFEGADLFLNFGVEYAYLRLNEDYQYSVTGGAVATIDRRSKAWGIGPQAGFELDYEFANCCCWPGAIMMKAVSSASLLDCRCTHSDVNILSGATLLRTSDKSTWRIIPALHARVSINMESYTCWGVVGIEIGYEFNSYIRGLTRVMYPDDEADSLSYNDYSNFDVQGLFLSATLGF